MYMGKAKDHNGYSNFEKEEKREESLSNFKTCYIYL